MKKKFLILLKIGISVVILLVLSYLVWSFVNLL